MKEAQPSFGFQPYKLLIISNKALKNELAPAMFGQKQVTTSSHLVILLAMQHSEIKSSSDYFKHVMFDIRKNAPTITAVYDAYMNMIGVSDDKSAYDWTSKEAYISLGYLSLAAASIGINSASMESFVAEDVSKILESELKIDSKKYRIAVATAFPRARISNDDFVIFAK